MDRNLVILIGRVATDLDYKQTQNSSVCNFNVVTNKKWRDKGGQEQEQAEFHSITAWGKLADICKDILSKGKRVYVEGELRTDSWEQDGVKRYKTKIIANNVIMLDRKEQVDNSNLMENIKENFGAIDNIPF